jgi:pyruvate,water dikinase
MKGTMSPAIKPLDEMTAADESKSGAKAYNCARLRQAGFRVPDGIVILSSAKDDDIAGLAYDPWFDGVPDDEVFAVRSSGIGEDGTDQSFAGIHQTSLNVYRPDLSRAIAECRESGRSPQALEYRRANGLPTDSIQIAVLIQRMIQPIAAGVAFTTNPVNGCDNELVINSSWGIGEALVSGQVDPDEFVIRKHDGELLWSRMGEKGNPATLSMSLTPDHVRELALILIATEQYYGAPQDVEWCHDGTDFWIVQSRPVTTGRPRRDEIEWTRANLVEVLPDVTSPQALSAFEQMLNKAQRQYLGKLLAPDDVRGPMLKSFCGRLYFNLSQMRRICALGNVAPAEMLKSMGHSDAIQPEDEKPLRATVTERLSVLPDFVRMAWRHLRAARLMRDHEARTQRDLRRFTTRDPRSLRDDDIWTEIEDWFRTAPDGIQIVLLLGGVLFHETPVRKFCERVGFAFERLVYPQLATGERSVSAQQAFDLVALADTARREPSVAWYLSDKGSDLANVRTDLRGTAFVAELEKFLEKYGHRGRYESDWSLPRYSEDPTPLLYAIRAHIDDRSSKGAADITSRQERESWWAWEAFEKHLSPSQRLTTLPRIRQSVRKIKQYYIWREQVRSDVVRVLAETRKWHLVLADRFVDRGWLDDRDEYFLLHLTEIAAVIKQQSRPDNLRNIVASRVAETARHRSMQMPLLMRESELPYLIRTAAVSSLSDDESRLTGHPVSGGCVEAEVVVVRDPADFARMKAGAILVAPATDPSWTPLFTLASGVIVEVGGVLSHASTIAREYGLPALANVKHATKRLRTGERVRLDAIRGVVQRLQHTAVLG